MTSKVQTCADISLAASQKQCGDARGRIVPCDLARLDRGAKDQGTPTREHRGAPERLDARMDAGFANVDARFANVDGRFNSIDGRFNRVEGHFNRLERKLDQFIDTQSTANDLVERRLQALEPPSAT